MKELSDLIHQIKQSQEYISYINAKQGLSDVSRGGKYFYECSFMDISVRTDRLENRKEELIAFIGTLILDKFENELTETQE